MARGWNKEDPDKGKPHRHVQAKIRLVLSGVEDTPLLTAIIVKIAEKRPGDVFDAVLAVMGDDD